MRTECCVLGCTVALAALAIVSAVAALALVVAQDLTT